jgi:hypothetical protein
MSLPMDSILFPKTTVHFYSYTHALTFAHGENGEGASRDPPDSSSPFRCSFVQFCARPCYTGSSLARLSRPP